MKAALALLLMALPRLCMGQQTTTLAGDVWVDGKAGVGTASPAAHFEVRAASASGTVFQVSGVDETPFLQVDNQGRTALSTTPAANLDIWGVGDAGDIGLQLRNGALYASATTYQILFGYAGTPTYRHAWGTRHTTTTADSSLDFYLWTPTQGASDVGVMEAMSLVTLSTPAVGGAGVQVHPASGTMTVELTVSDGHTIGAGTVHRAYEAQHSSKELKTDIGYLDESAGLKAYEETRGLKPVKFRYRNTGKKSWLWFLSKKGPMHRGLLYEEAPDSLRGPGRSLSVDQRVVNAELAAKEFFKRLEALSEEAAKLPGAPR